MPLTAEYALLTAPTTGRAEGDRFGKVSIPSSRDRATVHRTAAFESFDSPQHKYHTKIKDHPDGWPFILVERMRHKQNPKKFELQPFSGCFLYFYEEYSRNAVWCFLR